MGCGFIAVGSVEMNFDDNGVDLAVGCTYKVWKLRSWRTRLVVCLKADTK